MIRIKAGGAGIRSGHYPLLSGQLLTNHQADLGHMECGVDSEGLRKLESQSHMD